MRQFARLVAAGLPPFAASAGAAVGGAGAGSAGGVGAGQEWGRGGGKGWGERVGVTGGGKGGKGWGEWERFVADLGAWLRLAWVLTVSC